MGLIYQTALTCDGIGCTHMIGAVVAPGGRAELMRQRAKSEGWVVRPPFDYCPKCAERDRQRGRVSTRG